MALPSYDELVSQKLPSYEDLTALPSYDSLVKDGTDKPGASISGWGALPVPQWMTNAVEGVSNAAKAFVPESIRNDPMGLVTLGPETLNQLRDVAATMSPASGSIEELKKAHEIVSGVINGDTFEQATRKAAPDALELADAGKTPALSKERFQAATNVAAQMLMAAGIVHSHVKAGEVPKDVPASPNPEPSEQSTVQGPMEVPPSAPSDNPAMARFQPAAQDQLRPALRLKDGSVITGNPGQLHADMMDALPKDVQESIDYKDRGFTNAAGNYLDPEQAFRWAKNRGVNVDALDSAEAGQLDASELSKVNPPSVPSATEANSALGKPNETVSSTERPVGDSAPTGETLGGSNEPPSSAAGAATGEEPVRAAVDETPTGTENVTGQNAPVPEPTGIAKRFIQEDVARGVLPPEALVDGQGWTPEAAIAKGRELINKGVDPNTVLDALKGNRKFPNGVRDAGDAVAVLHAERERLSAERASAQKAARQHPAHAGLQEAARKAEEAELKFLRTSKPAAGGLAQRMMVAFQDAQPVDLSTFDGLYKKAISLNDGRELAPGQKAELARRASKAQAARKIESEALGKLQTEMDRTLPKREVPTDHDLAAEVERMVQELTPCQ